jgi:hypothetical protein
VDCLKSEAGLPVILGGRNHKASSNRDPSKRSKQPPREPLYSPGIGKISGALEGASGHLALPVERALFDSVNETDHQDHHKPEHAAKDGPWVEFVDVVSVHHRPWIHKDDLDIE